MAMAAVYTNFGGTLVSENRGGVQRQYLSDPLGSLMGELDTNETLTYTAEYWPYGETQKESGISISDWRFIGLLGGIQDMEVSVYARARHYLPLRAVWLTADKLWPSELAYMYANGDPIAEADPSGLQRQGANRHKIANANLPCDICAADILFNWWPDPAHKKAHKYIHCMTCCVLTALGGTDCAFGKQMAQNVIDAFLPPLKQGNKGKYRYEFCTEGITLGWEPIRFPNKHAYVHCHEGCSKLQHLPPGVIPPPYLPRCEPSNWHLDYTLGENKPFWRCRTPKG